MKFIWTFIRGCDSEVYRLYNNYGIKDTETYALKLNRLLILALDLVLVLNYHNTRYC